MSSETLTYYTLQIVIMHIPTSRVTRAMLPFSIWMLYKKSPKSEGAGDSNYTIMSVQQNNLPRRPTRHPMVSTLMIWCTNDVLSTFLLPTKWVDSSCQESTTRDATLGVQPIVTKGRMWKRAFVSNTSNTKIVIRPTIGNSSSKWK